MSRRGYLPPEERSPELAAYVAKLLAETPPMSPETARRLGELLGVRRPAKAATEKAA